MIERGHGSASSGFVDSLLTNGAAWSDPDPANGRAIRAYEKAGIARTVSNTG